MECDRVIVVVFLNRMEFETEEEFMAYPRNEFNDIELLESLEYVDGLFLPSSGDSSLYHQGAMRGALISYNGPLAQVYELSREPHKFSGLATAVLKMIGIIQPTYLYMGRKCFQSVVLMRMLLEDLMIPVEVVETPILRRSDGILYDAVVENLMGEEELNFARLVFPALLEIVKSYLAGELDVQKLVRKARFDLESPEVLVDYIDIVDMNSFESLVRIDPLAGGLLIIVTTINGRFKLSDNVILAPTTK